ncbi:MAG: SGNH/GDSL hydrolase family protein [Clostridia bacterium]|nr:SGNH/GDSL hydrolase family protein [Clostridia bacterium]
MKLTLQQICSAARGIVRAEEVDGKVCLYRFTKEQEELYKTYSADFYKKTFATAGVVLEFATDSKELYLEVDTWSGSSRKYFEHSVFVNGKKYASLDCRGENCGLFAGKWTLPDGEKQIKIYFPWSAASRIVALCISDGASFTPIKSEKRMIMFGDSITHGYDAKHPENSYASRLTDALGVDAVNKGIGGEIFFPALAECRDGIEPEYITVAYGTNDWSKGNKESFETKCRDFYTALSKNYPNAKIFALTPIWRKACRDGAINDIGKVSAIGEYIESVAKHLPNVTVIDGSTLVPAEEKYFSPDILHPNDAGFEHYFKNLLSEIEKHI